jgi:hypothetical protein
MKTMVRLAPRLATALLATGLACGGGDEPEPSGPPMLAPPAEKATDNRAPVIESIRIEPRYPARGDRIRAVLRTRDPEGDSLEIGYLWKVDGEKLPVSGPELQLSDVRKGSTVEVRAIASDGLAESEPARTATRILNRKPVIRGLTIEPLRTVALGEPVTVSVDAEDPDGDALQFSYGWTVNEQPVTNDLKFLPTTDLSDGDVIQVEVTASDGDSQSQSLRSGPVRVVRVNSPPAIVSRPGQDQPGEAFRYTVEGWDPDGDPQLRYSLRRAPEGMEIDPVSGEVTWRPEAGQVGKHPVEVVVKDSQGAFAVQSFELVITENAEAPPADVEE